MATCEIIVHGYDRRDRGGWRASPTTVLVRDGGKLLLCDPGANPELLRQALAARGLQAQDIDLIFITHFHPDHFLNIRLFPETPVMDGLAIWQHDLMRPHRNRLPDWSCRLLSTPGHTQECVTLLVPTEKDGTVAIAGDVFWWSDGEEQVLTRQALLHKRDHFAVNPGLLQLSRQLVLDAADLVIPGHGAPFRRLRP